MFNRAYPSVVVESGVVPSLVALRHQVGTLRQARGAHSGESVRCARGKWMRHSALPQAQTRHDYRDYAAVLLHARKVSTFGVEQDPVPMISMWYST